MHNTPKNLLICISLPLIIGGLSGFLASNSMAVFQQLNKPPLSPPGFLFPIIWTILYILMGIASYQVLISNKSQTQIMNALAIYILQLVVNFFWSIFFFNLEWYLFSFFWLILLWLLILKTIKAFYAVSKSAAYLLIPYLIWVTFAGYLNLGIYLLN